MQIDNRKEQLYQAVFPIVPAINAQTHSVLTIIMRRYETYTE